MSRRGGSGFSGANAIPLGPRNRAIGAKRSFTSSPPEDEPHNNHMPPQSYGQQPPQHYGQPPPLPYGQSQQFQNNMNFGPPPPQQMMPMMNDNSSKPVSDTATAALKAAQAAAANLAKLTNLSNKGKNDDWKAPEPQAIKRENNTSTDEGRGRPRKKKSRWGQPDAKTVIPGMPAAVPSGLTDQQQKAYIGEILTLAFILM